MSTQVVITKFPISKNTEDLLDLEEIVQIKIHKAVQRTAISPPFEPDQNCTLPLVKNGKIGNTRCLIGILNIIGYIHIVSIRTTFVPS